MHPPDASGEPRSEPDPPATRAKRPWWLPHFLGRVPVGLDDRHLALVGIVAFATLAENYDQSMLSAALKQIRESFSLTQGEASSLFAWIRLGAVPALFVVPLADRIGRRRVFLFGIVGMSIGTVLSAFAQDAVQFVAMQTITRTFIVAAIACAVVIVAEELPAAHRGWGIGILGAIGAFGFGIGAILYAFIDSLPFGWRSMYIVGGAPLLFLGRFRRLIPETTRFREEAERRAASGEAPPGWITPLVSLLRENPARSLGVAAMALFFAIGASPAFGLLSDFVQTSHGWTPGAYSAMALVAGTVGIVGNPAMGWAADRFGRRPVSIIGFGLFPVAAAGLYLGPASLVPFVWIPFVFLLTGCNVLMRVVASELFPTSSRNTAMGWETLFETLGGAAGYALVGGLTASEASIAPAAVGVALVTLVGAAVMFTLPETARRELEETSR